MRAFLHGLEARPHKTYQIEWHLFYTLCNFTFCRCFHRQAWCFIPQLQTIFSLTLEEMGHPQPPTPINCNNSMTVGITNNIVKQQCSHSMEMQFSGLQMQLPKRSLTSNIF